jgi:hypothetical protein
MNAHTLTVAMVLTAAPAVALGDTVDLQSKFMHGAGSGSGPMIGLDFTGLEGGSSAGRVTAGGRNYRAGHLEYMITTGSKAGTRFNTFCLEISQTVANGEAMFQMVELTQAPDPGPTYSNIVTDRINAVVANAFALGWIDRRLQADASQTNYLGRMGAIQAAIWDAMGATVDIDAPETSTFVRDAYNELLDASTFDDSRRLSGLMALTNDSRQDMLYVVPLPPASLAGAGLLALGLGARVIRRR